MWPEFKTLWVGLRQADGQLLLAGGYGLFLKQAWLTANPGIPTVVSLDRWLDVTPRVTKDIDLVVSLDVIAQAEANKRMTDVLAQNGYAVSAANPRWQFEKTLSPEHRILLDLHAPRPSDAHAHLSADRSRVKHVPSLGDAGIHGRTNPEAVGGDIHPFQFEREGVSVVVPNPITWAMMKLTAMSDRLAQTREADRPADQREWERLQAVKHAQDVCRVAAMVTLEERDRAEEVLTTLRGGDAHEAGREIFARTFADDQGDGVLSVADRWTAGDLDIIRAVLGSWFR